MSNQDPHEANQGALDSVNRLIEAPSTKEEAKPFLIRAREELEKWQQDFDKEHVYRAAAYVADAMAVQFG